MHLMLEPISATMRRLSYSCNAAVAAEGPIPGALPILRLAFEGHTGLIRTLDLSDGGRTLMDRPASHDSRSSASPDAEA